MSATYVPGKENGAMPMHRPSLKIPGSPRGGYARSLPAAAGFLPLVFWSFLLRVRQLSAVHTRQTGSCFQA